MKKKVFVAVVIIFMIGILAFYIWDVLFNNTPITKNLFRFLIIEFLLFSTLLRISGTLGRQDNDFYEKQYEEEIGDAFKDNILRKKLICAIRLYNENNFRKAIKYLTELKRDCKNPDDYKSVYLFTALCYTDLGAVYPAIEEYRELIKIVPEYFRAYSNLGILYEDCGDFKNANLNFMKSIELKPDNHFAYNNAAHCYFKQHNFDMAIQLANKALEINNNFKQSLSLLAIIYYILKDNENCEKYFHMAVSAGENADELKELFEIYTIEFNNSKSENEDER